MPQFDQITFFTQINWLIITFFFLYYCLLIHTPHLIALMKLRKKRLFFYNNLKNKSLALNAENLGSVGHFLMQIARNSKDVVSKHNLALNFWTKNFISNFFSEKIKDLAIMNQFLVRFNRFHIINKI